MPEEEDPCGSAIHRPTLGAGCDTPWAFSTPAGPYPHPLGTQGVVEVLLLEPALVEEPPEDELPEDELPEEELPEDELPEDELPEDELLEDEPLEPVDPLLPEEDEVFEPERESFR